MEHSAYRYIFQNYRIVDLPWDSPYTWYLSAIFFDFCYYWGHRLSHGTAPMETEFDPSFLESDSFCLSWISVVPQRQRSTSFGPTIRPITAPRSTVWSTSSVCR